MRTHLWSLFNKLASDGSFEPEIKPGVSMPTFRPKKEEGRIEKKMYKISKPDIEHINDDNMNTEDLTSDSSDDEAQKEEIFQEIQSKAESRAEKVKTQSIKTNFEEGGYGEDKDKFDFQKMKINKDDKKQKKFDTKIGDLLSNFKRMREIKFGKKEDSEALPDIKKV